MLARGQRRTIVVVNRVKDLNKSDEEEKVQIVSRDNQIELLSMGMFIGFNPHVYRVFQLKVSEFYGWLQGFF